MARREMRPKFGHLQTVANIDPKFGSASEYVRVLVKDERGRFETLLLTRTELVRIRDRAKSSPEEDIVPSWLDKLRA